MIKFTIAAIISMNFFLLFAVVPTEAATNTVNFTPQITIDNDFNNGTAITIPNDTSAIAKYIRTIYKYAIGVVGIVAAVVLMIGGMLWITAAGNADRVSEAKAWIGASLTGLVLTLCSYLILATVNPALVNFTITPVKKVETLSGDSSMGCCMFKDESGTIQVGYSRCEYKARGDCRNDSGFYSMIENRQCYTIAECPQYGQAASAGQCDNLANGASCSVNNDTNIPGKCKDKRCVQCIKSGGDCGSVVFGQASSHDSCCSGFCEMSWIGSNKCK